MEALDQAHRAFMGVRKEIEAYLDSVKTESDTRLKIVDRILIEVLGWTRGDIQVEEPAGRGFVDYRLSCQGFARVIVEAKRDSRNLGTERKAPGRPYRLDGPVFSSEAAKEGIAQAIQYCGQKNAELACVTNGSEWVVFRGSRLGDGRDTMDGSAFVFPSLTAVEEKFSLFFDLLSCQAVSTFQYRAHFQEAEGRPIRASGFRRSLRTAASRRLLSREGLSGDIERVMNAFFRRISGDEDPDLLVKCFVVTKESALADNRLARISEDLVGRIKSMETDSADELVSRNTCFYGVLWCMIMAHP